MVSIFLSIGSTLCIVDIPKQDLIDVRSAADDNRTNYQLLNVLNRVFLRMQEKGFLLIVCANLLITFLCRLTSHKLLTKEQCPQTFDTQEIKRAETILREALESEKDRTNIPDDENVKELSEGSTNYKIADMDTDVCLFFFIADAFLCHWMRSISI